jgi:hypothetical protein
MRTLRVSILILGLIIPQSIQGQADPTNPPYSLQDVVALVEGGHGAARILSRVGPDCISFRLNEAAEAALTAAGANAALLEGLRGVCQRSNAPAPTGRQAAPQGVVEIIGELPPGWSRVVNQLAPSTVRTITLTAGRPAVIIVAAPGWCADRIELTMQAGEQRNWVPALRGKPWVGQC